MQSGVSEPVGLRESLRFRIGTGKRVDHGCLALALLDRAQARALGREFGPPMDGGPEARLPPRSGTRGLHSRSDCFFR